LATKDGTPDKKDQIVTRQYFESKNATSVSGWTTVELGPDGAANDIPELPLLDGSGVLSVEVENEAGGASLDGFAIQLKDHPNGEWYDYISSDQAGSGDFAGGIPNLPFAHTRSADDVASGSRGHFSALFHGAHAARFRAKSSGTSSIKVRGKMSVNV